MGLSVKTKIQSLLKEHMHRFSVKIKYFGAVQPSAGANLSSLADMIGYRGISASLIPVFGVL